MRAARLGTILARRGLFVALAFLAFVLLVAFVVSKPPTLLLGLVGALLLLTLVRPVLGWMALAAVVPFSDLLGRFAALPLDEFLHGGPRSSVPSGEPLVLAFLGGWFLREALRSNDRSGAQPPAMRLVLALAGLFALAVTASLTVQLIVQQVSTAFPLDFATLVWRALWHDYYLAPQVCPSVPGTVAMLEGIGLFAATVILTVERPGLAMAGTKLVAGCASLVAAGNLLVFYHLTTHASVVTTWRDALSSRVSYVFPDVNTAGSYFVMTLFAAAGLVAASVQRFAAAAKWVLGVTLILAGLWLSGSRTAFAAAIAVAVVFALQWRRRGGRAAIVAVLALALFVGAGYVVARWAPHRDLDGALGWRKAMAVTAFRMTRTYPIYGIGAGRFYETSPEFSDFALRENAHNNFLQILAELGIVGFVSFALLLGGVLASVRRELGRNGWVTGLAAGALAFVATWLGGHPLLTREVAVVFWLVLGLLAGGRVESTGGSVATHHARRLAVRLLAVLVLLPVPLVAERRLAATDLTREGRGFSQWHAAPDGTRFRWMFSHAVLYVPSTAATATIPVRSPAGPAVIRARIAGQPAIQLVIDAGTWYPIQVVVPKGYSWRSVPVELTVRSRLEPSGSQEPEPSADNRVQVAAVQALPPH